MIRRLLELETKRVAMKKMCIVSQFELVHHALDLNTYMRFRFDRMGDTPKFFSLAVDLHDLENRVTAREELKQRVLLGIDPDERIFTWRCV